MPTIEELRAQISEMEEAARKEGQSEYEAIRKAATFEWKFEREQFRFHVLCRYDAPTRAAMKAWRERFPKVSINPRDPDDWHGMWYTFGYTKDGTPFVESHGGSVILDLDRRSFGPVAITPEQAAQFESGIIPPELMKPW